MNKILFTGAAGYIGRHILPLLLSRGYEVHVFDIVENDRPGPGVVWHAIDLLDHAAVRELVKKIAPEGIIHLAWNVGPGYNTAPFNLDWTMATLNLIAAFRECGGKRAVFAGSAFEYDPNYGCCVENLTPLTPPLMYAKSKAALSGLVRGFAEQHGISLGWARYFSSYGPFEKKGRLVPAVINSILEGEPVKVSHCNMYQDFSYVQDLGEATFALFESAVTGPVNLGSGRPLLLRDLVTKIAGMMDYSGEIQWGAIPTTTDYPFSIAATERLNKEVGWTHKVSLEEGLQRTIDWWKKKPKPS